MIMKKTMLIVWVAVFTVWFVLVVVDLFVDILVKNMVIEGHDAIRARVCLIASPLLLIWASVSIYLRNKLNKPVVLPITKPIIILIWAVFGTLLVFLIVLFIRDGFIHHTLSWEYSNSLVLRFFDIILPLFVLIGYTRRYMSDKQRNESDLNASK